MASKQKDVMLRVYAHSILNPNQCTFHRGTLHPCYSWYHKRGLILQHVLISNKGLFVHTDIQFARRDTIFLSSGSESRTRKLGLLYGDFVWGIFNMAAETPAQLERALCVNNVRMKDFESRTS